MNSLVKVFSNFKEFYNEINGATLTGAIDVIVVEQPDGEFQCSPFHVRFGKLGVLRSREKIVDIEINGEPVDIHMKLGESGEAFFVEECPEDDVEELPENMATSPIPTNFLTQKYTENPLQNICAEPKPIVASDSLQLPLPLPLPLPRRNSIDFSKEGGAKDEEAPIFENQVSDFSHRRHTDNVLERRNLSDNIKEYTTQKLRQEWAEHEEIFQFDAIEKDKDWSNSTQTEEKPAVPDAVVADVALDNAAALEVTLTADDKDLNKTTTMTNTVNTNSSNNNDSNTNTNTNNNKNINNDNNSIKEESKSKKKRRKKSQMKKKNAQRNSSSSSSTPVDAAIAAGNNAEHELDTISNISISNNTSSSNEDLTPKSSKSAEQASAPLYTANDNAASEFCQTTSIVSRIIPDLDIHFFSDTEATSAGGNGPISASARGAGRPSTPIQSDSELEISLREKEGDTNYITSTASWKWGELPTPKQNDGAEGQAAQAQHNSMLSGMFNFMKKTNKFRKPANDGGVYLSDLDAGDMDPEIAAMYFPNIALAKETSVDDIAGSVQGGGDDDRESGNGTSLPHSPSSMEGQKSVDSDYEDGKLQDKKYLDFVAMSLCGVNEKGDPTDEEFDRHLIKYSDVCENPSLFSSPNLFVRLNGKYYSWAAACPIVMTIIIFQKPLSDHAIEQLMTNAKQDSAAAVGIKSDVEGNAGQAKRSWWYWRRSQSGGVPSSVTNNAKNGKNDDKDGDQTAVATQTTRPNSPDDSDNTLSKTDSALNAENTSAMVENLEDLSLASSSMHNKSERYKKSLRLTSEAIKMLNLKDGVNEIEFSVTTAYQGTTRCKCYLFRWKHSDKVVISDIDGTITRSDVLGHILPMVGKDWAQLGVAQLFSKIEQNGYKLLYLSARAIGQSRATREYLRSIRQGDVKLPDGPLLLNPTSLISAFHREVIEKKPEQFKIACLSDIRDLFPEKDPFYAGYGNRINDVWAYRAVGIPIMRIFTINTKGELKHELTQTFQSSGYLNQSSMVDEYFPALDSAVYEYRTDIFDDDEEEDELKFSETDDDVAEDEEVFSDDYADDGIGIDDEDGLITDKNSQLAYAKTEDQRRFLNAIT